MSQHRTGRSRTRAGGGVSLCVIPGVLSSGNAPIQTDLLGGLPGGVETLGIVGLVSVVAVAGRWLYRRLDGQPLGAATAHDDVEVAADSDELWDELDRQREPTAV